ncbi:MAG: cell wall metabolism sensor histidine kinase WalK [Clostridiaceae bacterium]|nr:cell wall metabolism sensor histidine kinase WalK [Clostridiaceae bacterium]
MRNIFAKTAFFRSIQWRLVLILVLTTFVLMSVVWVFLNARVENIFYDDFRTNIETNYNELGINEENTDYQKLFKELKENALIAGFIHGHDKSYTILDKSTAEILYSSDVLYETDKLQFRNEIFKSENLLYVLSQKDANVVGNKQKYTKADGGNFYDYVKTQKLKDGEYVLFFKYNRDRALVVLEDFSNAILLSTVISLFAAVVIGSVLSRTITLPINDIMHKAEKITDGEFGYALTVKSDDEVGKLTQTFNFMSSRLKSMLTEITSEKKKLETILDYMTDGIIAYNRSGEVILTNPAAEKLLKSKTSEIVSFDEFMNILGISLKMDDITEENNISEPLHKVQYKDKFIKIHLAIFTDENNQTDGVIAVIQDITEEHRLDNMRKEFVANVSHELRTPLTSVKSYTETLLDGALQDRATAEQFLGVINEETDRMTNLVKDLLTLSQHDGGIVLNLDDISIGDLVGSCIERMKREAKLKNQELKSKIKHGLPIIQGDRYRIDQLIINIIGNAIKYTPEKGKIMVQVHCDNDNLIISVEDNGIGIPAPDLGRIFERFYRVDKARSRQMGGTGLGLAIAKEIAILHGGNITVKSKLGKGTNISVLLPIRKARR